MLKRLEVELEDSDQLTIEKRSEPQGKLKTKPGLGRLTNGGLLRGERQRWSARRPWTART